MSPTLTGLTSEARVPTNMPRRYLGQLCKHFQHKLPVTLDEWRGRIEFPAGACELDAAAVGGTLLMRVTAQDQDALARLEDVVGRHFERFAFRDELKVQWTRTV
ncbi:MAG TPA: DUF2218 domain-containing protein [Rhodopila sp.]|uniref:DUF2218 domain-containing protein n=1 Tax=Rhodopila sp. TaxID=2480087 RepID=UPI002B9D2CA2|nr:DUF2218 domain-containing protein [Rhodopila sp.]HVY16385.1 DUF2218 domain-containing protein [Rhodopila sp.]